MRRILAVATVLLVVLAGCSGGQTASPATTTTDGSPTTTTTPTTTTPTPTTSTRTSTGTTTTPTVNYSDVSNVEIPVRNGNVPYDQNLTYVRVQRMLGTNFEPPGILYVRGQEDIAGSTSSIGEVVLDSQREAVLVHEFAHSILLRATEQPGERSVDQRFAVDATKEGAAEYLEARYTERYLDHEPFLVDRLPEDPARAYFLAQYHFGYQYAQARVDDPRGLVEFHANPANTSEQVIHGLDPASEPPAPLATTPANQHFDLDATWRYDSARRLGEIGLLLTMRTRLGDEAAAAAADGWGNDEVTMFESDRGRGFVWIVRWDSPSEAEEFRTHAREFARSDPPATGPAVGANGGGSPFPAFTEHVWGPRDPPMDVQQISENTTALLVGPEAFVDGVSFRTEDGEIRIAVGDESPG